MNAFDKLLVAVFKAPGQDSTSINPATPARVPPWPGAEWKPSTHRWINPTKQAIAEGRKQAKRNLRGQKKATPRWMKNLLAGRAGGAKNPKTSSGDAPVQRVRTKREKPAKTKGKKEDKK